MLSNDDCCDALEKKKKKKEKKKQKKMRDRTLYADVDGAGLSPVCRPLRAIKYRDCFILKYIRTASQVSWATYRR